MWTVWAYTMIVTNSCLLTLVVLVLGGYLFIDAISVGQAAGRQTKF